MIDLKSIENAMSDISSVGLVEHKFEVHGKTYVLWPLNSEQEREVFEYAEVAYESDSEERGQAESIAFMDRFRIAAISQSLVVIGDLDLRNQEEIETGVVMSDGKKEFISRYQALRKIVSNWSKPLLNQVFLHFGELGRKVEASANQKVRYNPTDLSSELENLQERLAWLKDQVERQENPSPDLLKRVQDQITETSNLQSRHWKFLATGTLPEEGSEDVSEVSEEPDEEDTNEPPRQAQRQPPRAPEAFQAAERPVPRPRYEDELEPLAPQSPQQSAQTEETDPRFRKVAPPPTRDERPPVQRAPEVETQESTPQEFEQKFYEENPDIDPGSDLSRYTHTGDSLLGDDENATIEAEGRRQALLRQRRIAAEMEQQRREEELFEEQRRNSNPAPQQASEVANRVHMTPGGVMVAPGQVIPGQQTRRSRPSAPHQEAAEVQRTLDASRNVGKVQGVPAYKLPRQELSKRTQQEAARHRSGRVVVDNPGGGNESLNPRFTGRRRQR